MNIFRTTLHTNHARFARGLLSRRSFHRTHVWQDTRVKILRPWASRQSRAIFVLYCLGTYAAFKLIVFPTLDALTVEVELDEDIEEGSDQPIFIPLQRPTAVPQKALQKTDPEYQALRRDVEDQQRWKEIVGLVLARCRQYMSSDRMRGMVGTNIKFKNLMLDTVGIPLPPPNYIRSGLEIDDEGIMWSTDTMPYEEYVILREVLWPNALSFSLLSASQWVFMFHWASLKNSLGFNLTTHQEFAVAAYKRLQAQHQETLSKDSQVKTSSNPLLRLAETALTWPAEDTSLRGFKSMADFFPLAPLVNSTDLFIFRRLFFAFFIRRCRSNLNDKPRKGALPISGQVLVEGSRGGARCAIFGYYLPNTDGRLGTIYHFDIRLVRGWTYNDKR